MTETRGGGDDAYALVEGKLTWCGVCMSACVHFAYANRYLFLASKYCL